MEENMQSAVADGAETAEAQPEPLRPSDEVAELAQRNAELQDRVLRLQAEFDNFRKRTERERMEFAEYAGEQTVRALLPILDDFERALKAVAPGTAGDEFV